MLNINATKFTTIGALTTFGFKANNAAVLTLGGNFATNDNFYANAANGNITLNLQGYNFFSKGSISWETENTNVNISFGNPAVEGEKVIFAIGSFSGTGANTDTLTFKDYDMFNDLILVKTALTATQEANLIFEGYEGYTLQKEKIVGGEYNGYTSYYLIPEPTTVAAIFGALALGLAIYRRRK